MSETDVPGEVGSQVTEDPGAPTSPGAIEPNDLAGSTRVSARDEPRPEPRKDTRNDTPGRHAPAPNGRPMPWPTGPTRPLPVHPGRSEGAHPGRSDAAVAERSDRAERATAAQRPTIPAAREGTTELQPIPNPPSVTPAPAPAQPDRGTSWPSRPAPDDAAAEVWALVEKAQGGDGAAFGQIYDRYMDTVFRFIYFRVASRPLAEDLTADTFLRALKRIGSFTWQGRDLGAWLVTIARNLVADHFKSGRYRLEVPTGDVLDADREDRGPEGSPELAVVDHITNVALLGAVRQLNPEQQECIVLRFLHGFSVAETAQAMGKNEGAIKALQYRAVRALHRLLPDGFQP